MVPSVVILTGFDRSGTSAISRTIATHPQVELLWRMFNSSSLREKMNSLLNDELASEEIVRFFSELEHGRLRTEFIKSPYYWEVSTVTDQLIPGHLHVAVTTINHMSVPWVLDRFPGIGQWGIWRDPYHILQSVIENGFFEKWYGGAFDELADVVKSDGYLRDRFAWAIPEAQGDIRKAAFVLATRNFVLFKAVGPNRLIDYDLFCSDANRGLSPLLERYGLDRACDFSSMLGVDLNTVSGVVPYRRGRVKRLSFQDSDVRFLSTLFAPLFEVVGQRDELFGT